MDRPLVLGTAGHIDHGKTALITRLTGTNTDRLREERERGISIELGYAQLQLPGGRLLGVVDVPGHERFVRTMVAGATGVDLFLLVVAADDGVMPQTVEHVAILELLDVPLGVVALTKIDLVDEELQELVREDVTEYLGHTRYAGTPVVPVSSRDGRGVSELLAALEAAAAAVPTRRSAGGARLPVDRVFSLKGIGTVATGTLWRGVIAPGDTLTVQPGGARVGVRSVEVHESAAQTGQAGQRVGVNLRGAERAELERGRWLVAPPLRGVATSWFDTWLRLLPGARALRPGARVRLHHGTAQHQARVQLLDRTSLSPGEQAPVVLRLDGEAYVEPGDRFILRALSPLDTIGGGEVLSVVRVPGREAHAAFLRALHDHALHDAVVCLTVARGAAGLAASELMATVVGDQAPAALREAAAAGVLEEISLAEGPRYFAPGTRGRLQETLAAALRRRAAERPDRPVLTASELVAEAGGVPAPVVEAIVADMVAAGAATRLPDGVAPAAEKAAALAGRPHVDRIAGLVEEAEFSPPTLGGMMETLGLPRREVLTALGVLVREGRLVRVKEDLWFSAAAVDEARTRLLDSLARLPEVSLAAYRDLLGTGRRNAQALLEHFDGESLTRRVGDARVPRGRR